MLFNLLKKDFILTKKYLIFLLIYAVGMPIVFTLEETQFRGTSTFIFIVMIIEYMMLSTVWSNEEKNKGSILLCTTPYTRSELVKEKYLFLVVVFILNFILYTATALFIPIGMKKLSILEVGIALLISAIVFGIYIPILYKYGLQKTRYIGMIILFATIFGSPKLLSWMSLNHISINFNISNMSMILNSVIYLIALFIGLISMYISMGIYAKKDL
ncbi:MULTISPECIES: ABC-2 transporter permease [Clostridium]|uniref:ABC-2 transporter permease n=1 Tax=Clostridium cibarium TaxID=2762247 RepID=A0ABR8PSY1_9CLOT|nr:MULTISPECIES: ABC-2 transporter permease [Clostridium]MBD7911283.1 ABC-2 transporter permease [Clostridium cibarium]